MKRAAVLVAVALVAAAPAAGSTYRVAAYGPTWSPDGKHLAFVVHVKGTGAMQMLEVGDAEGKHARVVYSSTDACYGGPIQWASPSLLVIDDDVTVKTVSNGRETIGVSSITSLVVEPAAGGAARSLGVSGGLPKWSPDGRWIAFVGASGALRIVRATGGRANARKRTLQFAAGPVFLVA